MRPEPDVPEIPIAESTLKGAADVHGRANHRHRAPAGPLPKRHLAGPRRPRARGADRNGRRLRRLGTVRAQRFVLVDANGNELGEWRVDGSAPRLDMRSADQGRGVYVAVDRSPGGLTGIAMHGHGNRAILSTFKNDPGVGGQARLDLGNNDERAKIEAGDDHAPKLLLEQEGQVRALAAESKSSFAVIIGQKETLGVPSPRAGVAGDSAVVEPGR